MVDLFILLLLLPPPHGDVLALQSCDPSGRQLMGSFALPLPWRRNAWAVRGFVVLETPRCSLTSPDVQIQDCPRWTCLFQVLRSGMDGCHGNSWTSEQGQQVCGRERPGLCLGFAIRGQRSSVMTSHIFISDASLSVCAS